MKAFVSILLGLILLTSLVGISYATPIMQPQGSGDINACVNLKPNNPNYYALGCAGAAHQNGNENPPHHSTCNVSRIGPDFACCVAGQKADTTCCGDGITPNSLQVSDTPTTQIIQADTFNCGG